MPVNTLLQMRRGTAANWQSVNPILSAGEWGYETDTGRAKVGDGSTVWNSLSYTKLKYNDLITGSGISITQLTNANSQVTGLSFSTNLVAGTNITLSNNNGAITINGEPGITISEGTGIHIVVNGDDHQINVSGLTSSLIGDFNSAVDARITAASISEEQILDVVGTGIVGGTGIYIDYDDNGTGKINVNVSGVSLVGHNHDDRYYTETELNTDGAGGQVHWNNLTNKPTGFVPVTHTHTVSQITDFTESVQDTLNSTLVNGTGILLSYDDNANTLTVNVSGYAYTSHTHEWSQITDASTKATLTELGYLSGVTPGAVTANRALVVDGNKDLSSLRNLSATGIATLGTVNANNLSTTNNIIVGGTLLVAGNLNVSGTTTTVNSTTVDIGDNIIRVNVSGAEVLGGFEVQDHDNNLTHQLVWDINDSRWEFINTQGLSPNVYTSGSITASSLIGNGSQITDINFSNISTNIPDPIITGILTGNITGVSSVQLNNLSNGILSIHTILEDNTVTSAKIVDGTIVNADINDNAAIAVTKLAQSGITLGNTLVNLGQTSTIIDGLTRISGVSSANPTYIYYAIIDGGSP